MNVRRINLSSALTLLPLTLGHVLLTAAAFPSLGIRWVVAWPVLWLLAAAMCFLQSMRFGRFVLPCAAAASLIPAVIRYKCFSYLIYDFFTALQLSTGHIYIAEKPQGSLWPLWIFFAVSGAALQSRAAYRNSVLWLAPLLMPVLEGSVMGVLPVGAGTAALVIGMLLLCSQRANDLRASLQHSVAVLLCAALTAGCGALLRDAPQQKAVQRIRSAAHALVCDRRTNSMPEGQLGKLSAWNKNETPALRVTMENPQALYFRGAVYETYTGDAWQPLSAAARDAYGELFSWLHSESFYGQTAVYSNLSAQNTLKPQRMTVQNISACNAHGYLPYGAGEVEQLDDTLIGDAKFPAAESFLCLPTDPDTLYAASQRAAADSDSVLSRMEGSYAAYAQNVDLSVPQAAADALAEAFGNPQMRSKTQILTSIRTFLHKNITYDESVETRVKTDFVRETLEQGRGYSVHYATAAVLLLRMCGIPARYVEGYHLTASEAQKTPAGEPVVLTEVNAHAWAEYYLEGVGFVPFEVTPGYDQSDETDGETPGSAGSRKALRNPVGAPTPVPDPVPVEIPPQQTNHISPLWLLLLLPLLAVLWILFRRLRLRRMLHQLDGGDERERILGLYAYACALQKICPVKVNGRNEALLLFREAKFSDHAMTPEHTARMRAYCDAVSAACLRRWNLPQRIYYRYLRGVL